MASKYGKDGTLMRYNLNVYKMDRDKLMAYGIPEHNTEAFSKAFKRLVGTSSITQAALGKALKISSVTVFNYLHGYRNNPDMEFILSVSDFFDVKPSYFREYRIIKLNDKLCEYPELIDVFLDLADDSKRVIREYKEILNPLNTPSLTEIDEIYFKKGMLREAVE
jgi:transcriptional regulator with XRE-family HTH domain